MDRRRYNPPPGGTAPPLFRQRGSKNLTSSRNSSKAHNADEIRKIFLQTGLIVSASGSAYFESSLPKSPSQRLYSAIVPSLKLSCAVHGPHPQPRNAPFSTNLVINCHVRFAPFALRDRRGYARDAVERDIASHLETALRGVIIADQYPKCVANIAITVLEAEEYGQSSIARGPIQEGSAAAQWQSMSLLAGCITVASAAIVDAGIDCLDLVSGGMAVRVRKDGDLQAIETKLDLAPYENDRILSACVVGYLESRDEIVELWHTSSVDEEDSVETGTDVALVDEAVKSALLSRLVLAEALVDGHKGPIAED